MIKKEIEDRKFAEELFSDLTDISKSVDSATHSLGMSIFRNLFSFLIGVPKAKALPESQISKLETTIRIASQYAEHSSNDLLRSPKFLSALANAEDTLSRYYKATGRKP